MVQQASGIPRDKHVATQLEVTTMLQQDHKKLYSSCLIVTHVRSE